MNPNTEGSLGKKVDTLYEEAVALILASSNPSCSYLQRQLRTSASETKRLVEKMEANGIDHRIHIPEKIPDPLIIKIVLIGHAGSKNIEALISKKRPGMEFVIIEPGEFSNAPIA